MKRASCPQAHVCFGIPPCWGQCWVHRASKDLDKKCGDKPKVKKARAAEPGGAP